MGKLKKVQAFVAVEITPGPHLEEESVKDGLYGFRSLFCLLVCSVNQPPLSLVQEHRLLEEWGSASVGQPTCHQVVVGKCVG